MCSAVRLCGCCPCDGFRQEMLDNRKDYIKALDIFKAKCSRAGTDYMRYLLARRTGALVASDILMESSERVGHKCSPISFSSFSLYSEIGFRTLPPNPDENESRMTLSARKMPSSDTPHYQHPW